MGMFDRVFISCPSCGVQNEVQSKAGKCALDTYWQESVPLNIAIDIEGTVVTCDNCQTRYMVGKPCPTPETVEMCGYPLL